MPDYDLGIGFDGEMGLMLGAEPPEQSVTVN
jgi:hypothetical protein